MEIKLFVGERLLSEESKIARLDDKGLPVEWSTLEKLYSEGWRLISITPLPEENPFRVYVAVER